jgi:hypothetical protein
MSAIFIKCPPVLNLMKIVSTVLELLCGQTVMANIIGVFFALFLYELMKIGRYKHLKGA